MIFNKLSKPSLIAIILIAMSCNGKQEFTREKWSHGDGLEFPSRAAILDDLMAKHKLVGMKHYDVFQLIGTPQFRDTANFKYFYQIENTAVEYNPKRKPVYTKDLILTFNRDSVVIKTDVVEETKDVK